MKKFISALLAAVSMLTLCSCGGQATTPTDTESTDNTPKAVFADARTVSLDGKSEARNLNNTLSRLKNDKKLTVAYFGGSVTVGTGGTKGGWRAITTDWFKNSYPDAEITEVNAAIGGTATLLGLSRMDNDVLAHNPDLLFVEFAINDLYSGFSTEESRVFAESIVRRVNEKSPNTDIVFVLVTDQFRIGKDYANQTALREVAEYYGIPFIDVGTVMNDKINSGVGDWDTYFTDIVHPTNAGYEVYGEAITNFLGRLLSSATASNAPHTLPEKTYVSRIYNDIEIINPEQLTFDEIQWKLSKNKGVLLGKTNTEYALRSNQKSAELTVEFDGVGIVLFCSMRNGVSLSLTIDGKETKRIKSTENDTSELVLFDNLTDGKHTLTITCSESGFLEIGKFLIGK